MTEIVRLFAGLSSPDCRSTAKAKLSRFGTPRQDGECSFLQDELLRIAFEAAKAESVQASVNTSALAEAALAYGRSELALGRAHDSYEESKRMEKDALDRIEQHLGPEYVWKSGGARGLMMPPSTTPPQH